MRRCFALLLPAFFAAFPGAATHAQNQFVDSLRHAADTASSWQIRMDAQFNLAGNLHSVSLDSTLSYAAILLKEAEKRDYAKGKGMANELFGTYYLGRKDFSTGMDYSQKAVGFYLEAGEKENAATMLSNMAFTLTYLQRYGEASEKLFQVLDIREALRDTADISITLNGIGRILGRQKRFAEGTGFIRRALAIDLRMGLSPYLSYSRLGELLLGTGQLDSALYYQTKALETATSEGDLRSVALEQANLGKIYLKKGDAVRAGEYLRKSLAYFEPRRDILMLPSVYNLLADAENGQGNYRQALDLSQKALDALGARPNYTSLAGLHESRAKSYAGLGDYTHAYQESLAWKTSSDSLAAFEKAAQVADVESRYRTREQQATIAGQQLTIARQQNRNQNLLIGGLLALLLIGGIFQFLRGRERLKKQRAEYALALEQAEAGKLRELDKVKSAFFANISHEFRTPLTLIVGPLKELELGVFKGNVAKYYGIMRRNAERLLQLVNQLLDLSRLESGRLQLQPKPGELHAALRAVAYSFESLADQKQITYTVQVPQTPLWAQFDVDKLEKIVGNLLSNAFKFTRDEGSVQLTVDHVPAAHNIEVEIRVTDSGIGIPAEQQARIFERFYQVENTGADESSLALGAGVGSGIGLALTKELVTLYGGSIAVSSTENEGTTFSVRLPLTAAEAVAATSGVVPDLLPEPLPAKDQPEETRRATRATALPLILVVEDNPDVRAYVCEHLQGKYRLLEAADGQAGLQIATAEIPDLIVTDLMMPGLDGTALTRQLRSDVRTNHIPIVMLTAKADRSDRLEGLGAGAEAYLTKPFDAEELRLIVAKMIEQRRLLQEKFSKVIHLGLSAASAPSLDDLFLQKVLATIEENLDDETFGVEKLADATAMSRSNLFRKLHALSGKSPNVLIRELRLERARQLLERGAGNATEVAFMVGFNSATYFATCFREMFGYPPSRAAL